MQSNQYKESISVKRPKQKKKTKLTTKQSKAKKQKTDLVRKLKFGSNDQNMMGNFFKVGGKKIHFEDCRLTKMIIEQRKLVDLFRCIVLISSLFLAIFNYDLSFMGERSLTQTIVLYYLLFQTIFLEFLTFIVWYGEFKYYRAALMIPCQLGFVQQETFYRMLFEGLLIAVTPLPFIQEQKQFFTDINSSPYNRFYYVNEILTLVLLQRMWLIFSILPRLTEYFTAQVVRLGKLYSVRVGTLYILKYLLLDYPVMTQLYLNGFIIAYFSLILRVTEMPGERYLENGIIQLNENPLYQTYAQQIWSVYIVIPSVGYGDMYPKTDVGRSFIGLLLIFGLTLNSLLISGLISQFNLDKWENITSALVDRLVVREGIYSKAITMMDQFKRLYRYFKEKNQKDNLQVEKSMSSVSKSFTKMKKMQRAADAIDGFSTIDVLHEMFENLKNNLYVIKSELQYGEMGQKEIQEKLQTFLFLKKRYHRRHQLTAVSPKNLLNDDVLWSFDEKKEANLLEDQSILIQKYVSEEEKEDFDQKFIGIQD